MDNVIRFTDEQTRKRLRRALGGYEQRAQFGTLVSVLGNENLPQKVRQAAKSEIDRRYLASALATATSLTDECSIVERMMVDPTSGMSATNAQVFKDSHESRADVWIRLRTLNKREGLLRWLVTMIHYKQLLIDFESVKKLTASDMSLEVSEALQFGYDVFVGLKWKFDKVKRFVPPGHDAFTKEFEWIVTPFSASCENCINCLSIDMGTGIQSCPGTDRPRMSHVVEAHVNKNGCVEFVKDSSAARLIGVKDVQ